MPAIRVIMPNGTTKSFPEVTPKSEIRQAQSDMLAEMKTCRAYDGFDFAGAEAALRPKRKVKVTQYAGPLSTKGHTRLPQPNEMEKGEGGSGYGTYGTPANGEGQWGTPETMQVISAVTGRLANGAREVPFNIGNISTRDGGVFKGHSGHRDGDEIDVRPPRLDGKNFPTNWQSGDYDRAAMQQLVDAFISTGAVDKIYFNDPKIRGVVPAAKHDDHFHVKLKRRP